METGRRMQERAERAEQKLQEKERELQQEKRKLKKLQQEKMKLEEELKKELDDAKAEVARLRGTGISGLSVEELQQLKSRQEEGVRRVQLEVDRREAQSAVALTGEYNCPLTLDLMEDPVVASDGHTYERVAIEKVIEQARAGGHQAKSPNTNLPLEHTSLTPNHNLRSRILKEVDEEVRRKRARDGSEGRGESARKAHRPS